MEIHLEKSEIIFFSLATLLVLSLAFLWSALAVDTSKPWHPLSQIQIDQDLDLGSHSLIAYSLKVTGGKNYYMKTEVGDWPETMWLNPNDTHTYIYVKFNPYYNWGEIGTYNSTNRAKLPLNIFGNPVRIRGDLKVDGLVSTSEIVARDFRIYHTETAENTRYNATTSFETLLSLDFTAPLSGKILVIMNGAVHMDVSYNQASWVIFNYTISKNGEIFQNAEAAKNYICNFVGGLAESYIQKHTFAISHQKVFEGLTPGETYKLELKWRKSNQNADVHIWTDCEDYLELTIIPLP